MRRVALIFVIGLLTVAAIAARGLPLRGWVGNQLGEPMSRLAGNLATLRERIAAPCLGVVPHLPEPRPDQVAAHLNLSGV